MSGGVEVADQVRQSRTSIVLLIASAAAIYYSTQIYLEYGFFWWNLGIAIAGILFLVAGCYTVYKDWQHEQDYRDSLRRKQDAEAAKSQAEVEEVRDKQVREEPNEEESATVRGETEEMPTEEMPRMNSVTVKEEANEVTGEVE